MQQQYTTALGDEPAATFYAKLVDVPGANADAEPPLQTIQAQETHAAHCDWQQQHQQQPRTDAAAAADNMPFKPVKFAQPVVWDPNTAVMILPPATQNVALGADAQLDSAAGSVHLSRARLYPPRSRHGSNRGSSHQERQSATYYDLGGHSRYYCTDGSTHGAAARQQAAHPAAPSVFGTSSKQPIARSNLGFQLLQKAGWQEGMGLGKEEQGLTAPLQVQPQKGSRGLGFASQHLQQQQVAAAAAGSKDTKTAAVLHIGPVLGTKRVAALVAEELANESLETKLKRHKQVMEQEAKDLKGKAIQDYLRRAFNEPSSNDMRSDSNPLQRSNRLRAMNPLLDSDED